jgi:hypothetical protein
MKSTASKSRPNLLVKAWHTRQTTRQTTRPPDHEICASLAQFSPQFSPREPLKKYQIRTNCKTRGNSPLSKKKVKPKALRDQTLPEKYSKYLG